MPHAPTLALALFVLLFMLLFNNTSSEGRCQLLRRETTNLAAASAHFDRIREDALVEAAAWRLATEVVERRREAMLRQREADEAQLAEILARERRSDEE